jgi:hypothetical protein
MHDPASLPLDIILEILSLLNRSDRRICLNLNKRWHDIAIPLVFCSIYFHLSNMDPDRCRKTIELQQFLHHNTRMGRIVKELTVYYVPALSITDETESHDGVVVRRVGYKPLAEFPGL